MALGVSALGVGPLGGISTVVGISSICPEVIENHYAQALARLPLADQNLDNITIFYRSLLDNLTQIEKTACQLKYQRFINTASGKTLDKIGTNLSLPRGKFPGISDSKYRNYLRFAVLWHMSGGEADTLSDAVRLLTDSPYVQFWKNGMLNMTLAFDGYSWNNVELYNLLYTLVASPEAFTLIPVNDNTFRFDTGPGFDEGYFGEIITF